MLSFTTACNRYLLLLWAKLFKGLLQTSSAHVTSFLYNQMFLDSDPNGDSLGQARLRTDHFPFSVTAVHSRTEVHTLNFSSVSSTLPLPPRAYSSLMVTALASPLQCGAAVGHEAQQEDRRLYAYSMGCLGQCWLGTVEQRLWIYQAECLHCVLGPC
eukprot:TRINITY_DN1669_c0_g1_i1.p2 TRINITY_DN1669_c0_g1~~TRINITY_DN1669_c0_g1_i1.p2  ORF type:complete len:157 (+),score=4.19 TRINITY_DN1669_c0_g1_i1:162-632(+)